MKEEKAKKPAKNNLQQKYLSLSQRDQQGVTTFFNLHNAAHFVYEGLSEEAQNYVAYCIRLSSQADNIEKKNKSVEQDSAQV